MSAAANLPSASRRLPWWGKLALLVGAPLVCFVTLEIGLRAAGIGRNPDFFIPDDNPGWFRTNPRFTEMFFPASFGLKPVNFRLPRAKPAGAKRVFVIGESAAMGVPEPAFGLAPQLEAQLRAVGGGERVEVFNLGMTAINSHAILPVVRQALDFKPDLLVIYMGNNEVVGPYGSSSVVTKGPLPRWLIRLGLWSQGLRSGQALQQIAAKMIRRPTFRDWRGMEMFTGKSVAADDPGLARVRANFSANLADMLVAARAAGVPVVLSTVAVNLRDCSPFVSRLNRALPAPQGAQWQAAWEDGRAAVSAGEHARAREALTRAVALDPGHADSHFLLAVTEAELGDPAAARRHYLAALEADALRFRADAAINTLIREGARAGGASLVDVARELGSDPASTNPPPGAELFFEHVHFNWEGNFALARLVAASAAEALFGPTVAPRPWLDSAACAAAVGFTDRARMTMLQAMNELTGRPPFTGQWRYGRDRARLEAEIAALMPELVGPERARRIRAIVSAALEADPENPRLLFQGAQVELWAGDAAAALARLEQLARRQPPSAEAAVLRASALQALRRTDEAEQVLLRAVADEPYYFQSYGLLAQLWVQAGRVEHASAWFAELSARMPDSRAFRVIQGNLAAQRGDWPAAEREWRAALALTPDDENAVLPLLRRLVATDRAKEAIPLLLTAHTYNPRNFACNQRLVEYYEAQGDTVQVVRFMRDLAESGGVSPLLFRELALNLRKLGRADEARHALQRGRRVAAALNDTASQKEFDQLLANP